MELFIGDIAEDGRFAHPGAGPQHVDRALLPLDGVVQAVQVVQFGGVALHGGDVTADQLDGVVQGFLPPGLEEDVRSFLDEQLGAGQCHASGSAGDHRHLAIELSHDHSSGVGHFGTVCKLSTPFCLCNVSDGRPRRKLCTPTGTQGATLGT